MRSAWRRGRVVRGDVSVPIVGSLRRIIRR